MTILTRRTALIGSLSTLFAAPAIVRASSLMPVSVRAVPESKLEWYVLDLTTLKLIGRVEEYSTFTIQNIGLTRGQTVRFTTA